MRRFLCRLFGHNFAWAFAGRWDIAVWENVEVYGHTNHVGRVREVRELGRRFLRVDVPEYVHHRRRYPARSVRLAPGAIFRRTLLARDEAQKKLAYQTDIVAGEALPGLKIEEARARLGGFDLHRERAAQMLGIDVEVYEAIEQCTIAVTEERAQEIIADLAAAWLTYKRRHADALAREAEEEDEAEEDIDDLRPLDDEDIPF